MHPALPGGSTWTSLSRSITFFTLCATPWINIHNSHIASGFRQGVHRTFSHTMNNTIHCWRKPVWQHWHKNLNSPRVILDASPGRSVRSAVMSKGLLFIVVVGNILAGSFSLAVPGSLKYQ